MDTLNVILSCCAILLTGFVAYFAARYQLKLFIHNILSIKAKEATEYMDRAIDKTPESEILNDNFLHCISSIIQGWQMVDEFIESHCFVLRCPPVNEFENFLYLHLSTTIKHYLFNKKDTISKLSKKKSDAEKEVIRSQLNTITNRLNTAHCKFDPQSGLQALLKISKR